MSTSQPSNALYHLFAPLWKQYKSKKRYSQIVRPGTVSWPQLCNVFLAVSLSFLHVSAWTIHVQEVLNNISDSSFDTKPSSFQMSSVKDYDDFASSIVHSTCGIHWVKELNTASISFCILVQHNKAFNTCHCTFDFFSTYELNFFTHLYNPQLTV